MASTVRCRTGEGWFGYFDRHAGEAERRYSEVLRLRPTGARGPLRWGHLGPFHKEAAQKSDLRERELLRRDWSVSEPFSDYLGCCNPLGFCLPQKNTIYNATTMATTAPPAAATATCFGQTLRVCSLNLSSWEMGSFRGPTDSTVAAWISSPPPPPAPPVEYRISNKECSIIK